MFKLNYVMLYTNDIRDILADKLTMLFNKALLDTPIRLHLIIPEIFDIRRTDKYKEFFDEITISRFKPESSRFWNLRNLIKYKQYCFSCNIASDEINFYIDQQTIITSLPTIDQVNSISMFYNGFIETDEIEGKYRSILELLAKLKINYPKEDNFKCFDFRVCYLDDEIKKKLYFQLNEFIEKCPENRFFGPEECNILLSIFLKDISLEKRSDLKMKKYKFDEQILSNLYTII